MAHGDGRYDPSERTPGDPYLNRVHASAEEWEALEAVFCRCDQGLCVCGWDEELEVTKHGAFVAKEKPYVVKDVAAQERQVERRARRAVEALERELGISAPSDGASA